jgi:hypothetical protein
VKPRKDVKHERKAPAGKRIDQRRKLSIIKLEERVAPKLAVNHNETLVRDSAKLKTPVVRSKGQKRKLQIVKLEERIAPKLATNHNETLVRVTL